MRRRVVWTLIALTTALFWVGAGASAGGSIESGMREKLRLCGGPAAPLLEARTAASGSVALSWRGGSAGATRWEYRQQQEGGGWGAWAAIAGSDASTAEHTVAGLTEDARYHFQLRAITANGAGPASATASAVAGLPPRLPPVWLSYSEYDATGDATASGAFSLLTNAADLSSGIGSHSGASTATALLVNAVGYARRSYADVLSGVAVGDTFAWEISSSCWIAYRVTAVLSDPPAPARKLFAVALTTQDASCAGPISVRGSYNNLIWYPPPNEPRIGADGVRILPVDHPVEGGHTYRIGGGERVVIDVPAGMRLISRGVSDDLEAWFEDEASGSLLVLNSWTGRELLQFVRAGQGSGGETRDVGALFDAIAASARVQPE